MQAHIITIGDELLIGQVVDSNSAYIAAQVTAIGLSVRRITTVSDQRSDLLTAFSEIRDTDRLTIMTGGLGPTNDDITKKVLAEYLNTGIEWSEHTWQRIRSRMNDFGKPTTEAQREQCNLPAGCRVLDNDLGTAPGMWFDLPDGRIIVSLPGVPYEMKHLMQVHILPNLKDKLPLPPIAQRTLLTSGVGESVIAQHLTGFESELPPQVSLAYLPGYRQVRLRLTAKGEDATTLVNQQVHRLERLIPDLIFGYDKETLSEVIGRKLRDKGWHIATAESCTGGAIAAEIVQTSGASDYFIGGFIAYSNAMKQQLLGVPEAILQAHGAVSDACVRAMLKGLLQRTGANVGIAISGIAGPSGGTVAKPVGTTFIAVGTQQDMRVQQHQLGKDRAVNIRRATFTALHMLHVYLRGTTD